MKNALLARLECLETSRPRGIIIIPQYLGMNKKDALSLRFGLDGQPLGVTLVFISPAMPPPGVPYDWFNHRDNPAFADAWTACQADAAGVVA